MTCRKSSQRRDAIVNIWVAVFGLTLIGFVGLAMDTSYVGFAGQQLQNAADAAALAGALRVRSDIEVANNLAIDTAWANTAAKDPVVLDPNFTDNLPDGDIVVGRYDRDTKVFTPYDPVLEGPLNPFNPLNPGASLNAVRVVARRTEGLHGAVPLLFGPVFGIDTADVTREAIAVIGGGTGAGLLTLNDCTTGPCGCADPDCECSLRFSGNNDLLIVPGEGVDPEDADIQVDSGDACGVCGSGSALTIQADDMNIVGDACFTGNPTLDVDIHPDEDYVPDPLATLLEPTWDPADDLGCVPGCGLVCNGGPNEDQACLTDAECPPDGTCDVGGTLTCLDGPDAGAPCASDADCSSWTCSTTETLACAGGASDEYLCMTDADCPGGACVIAGNSIRFRPGYYSRGIRGTSAGTTFTLDPGVYIVDNVDGGPASGLYINGGTLIANEVMFFIVGQGVLFLAGNGIIEISPPADGYYEGISIFQARDNTNPATILGTSFMDLEGAYYFPVAPLELGGTGIALGNMLIAWDMWIHGTGEYTIQYDGRFASPGTKVFLVL